MFGMSLRQPDASSGARSGGLRQMTAPRLKPMPNCGTHTRRSDGASVRDRSAWLVLAPVPVVSTLFAPKLLTIPETNCDCSLSSCSVNACFRPCRSTMEPRVLLRDSASSLARLRRRERCSARARDAATVATRGLAAGAHPVQIDLAAAGSQDPRIMLAIQGTGPWYTLGDLAIGHSSSPAPAHGR
jgi:hypothetical protein